jgi:hypothetical protein
MMMCHQMVNSKDVVDQVMHVAVVVVVVVVAECLMCIVYTT